MLNSVSTGALKAGTIGYWHARFANSGKLAVLALVRQRIVFHLKQPVTNECVTAVVEGVLCGADSINFNSLLFFNGGGLDCLLNSSAKIPLLPANLSCLHLLGYTTGH